LIDYFEANGGRKCEDGENPAECTFGDGYLVSAAADLAVNSTDMLDVIGAGATAHTDIDWYSMWKKSPERQEMESQLQEILRKGKESPAVETSSRSEFSASFGVQLSELTRRAFLNYFRNPTYLISKYAINIFGGKCSSWMRRFGY
jgi:ATP-binding cassette, subfamily G (WHITE), member 2, PDR